MFTINLVGQIDDSAVKSVQNLVASCSPAPDCLLLNISSTGGNVSSGIALYNYLKSLSFPIHTHNLGEVSSTAILPYLAGSVRTTEPVSKFMFHQMEVTIQGSVPYPKLNELLLILETDVKNYAAIVEVELPDFAKEHDIVSLLKTSCFVLTANEARECGLTTGEPT